MARDAPALRLDRLAAVLPALCGRTIEQVFLAEYRGQRYRVIFAFTDGTTYEFFGCGEFGGSGATEDASAELVRERLRRDTPLQLHEVK